VVEYAGQCTAQRHETRSAVIAFFLRNYGTTGVFLFIATAMVSVFIVIASMGPRTTNLRLEAISR
jgi:MFS transporter, putative metabolite:H+ symporter